MLKKTPLRRNKRIRPVSEKRARELTLYRQRKRAYFDRLATSQGRAGEEPLCECCHTSIATDWHHVKARGQGGSLNQPDEMMRAVCGGPYSCHWQIHQEPSWAREKGFLV